MGESTTGKEKKDIQHLVNTTSTLIQHPQNVELIENAQTTDKEIDSEAQKFIQQTTRDEGERGCVEQACSENVLQVEPIANSFINQEDTSSKTNSLNSTSQQEAFQQKYQPVEVLNSEGKWVNGYWVHKCLVVANLEGIERKYSLVDELGGKYAFWGEIRLPNG